MHACRPASHGCSRYKPGHGSPPTARGLLALATVKEDTGSLRNFVRCCILARKPRPFSRSIRRTCVQHLAQYVQSSETSVPRGFRLCCSNQKSGRQKPGYRAEVRVIFPILGLAHFGTGRQKESPPPVRKETGRPRFQFNGWGPLGSVIVLGTLRNSLSVRSGAPWGICFTIHFHCDENALTVRRGVGHGCR